MNNIPETPEQTELRHWNETVRRIEKLMTLKAPKIIIAHYIMKVMIPRLLKRLQIIPEAAAQLDELLGSMMCNHYGVCCVCKRYAAAMNDNCCQKCRVECDKLEAEMSEIDSNREY